MATILTVLRKGGGRVVPLCLTHNPPPRTTLSLRRVTQGVVDRAAGLMLVTVTFMFFDGIQTFCKEIIIAVGRQMLGFWCNVVSYVLITMPLCFVFFYATSLEVYGLWWSLVVGAIAAAITQGFIIARLDWVDECARASARVEEGKEDGVGGGGRDAETGAVASSDRGGLLDRMDARSSSSSSSPAVLAAI